MTESPPADDVLEGFAAFTTGDQSVERSDAAHGGSSVEHTVELARLAAGDLFDDATGIGRRRLQPRSFEAGGGLREQLGPGDGASEIRNLGIVVAHSSSSS